MRKGILLIILGIFALQGCQFQENPIDPIIVPAIDIEFSIRMAEHLRPEKQELNFELISFEKIDCLNGYINYAFSQQEDAFNLIIKKVSYPLDCAEGIGPYLATVFAGDLEEEAIYSLTISLQDLVDNTGFLVVDEEKYVIKLNTLHGIAIPEKTLYKIPSDLIWGHMAIDELDQLAVANDFIATLSNYGTEVNLQEGKYSFFEVLSSGKMIGMETQVVNPLSVLPFAFSFQGDWEELTNEVHDFRSLHPEIEVEIFNHNGEVY